MDSLCQSHPLLASEWHPARNGILTPSDVGAGSGRRVWWQCERGHEWATKVEHRTKAGSGCPYCVGRLPTHETSLAAVHPTLAAEWHPSRNEPTSPWDVLPKSNKKVWWQCPSGHTYEARVADRSIGGQCPSCANRVLSLSNSLAAASPELAKEWDPSKNGRAANEVLAGSSKKAWWRCAQDHSWQASPHRRRAQTLGCPFCSNKAVSSDNNLGLLHPEVANQWDFERNAPLTPNDVVPGSNKSVWWRCSRGHLWRAKVVSRTRAGTGCPKCRPNVSKLELRVFVELRHLFGEAGSQTKLWGHEFDISIPSLNLLVEVDGYPWHQSKLANDIKKLVAARSHGHTLIRLRDVRLAAIDGPVITYKEHSQRVRTLSVVQSLVQELVKLIPLCSQQIGRVTSYLAADRFGDEVGYQTLLAELPGPGAERSVAVTHPDLLADWHPTKNGAITAQMVSAGSGETVWWKCQKGHEWQAAVYAKRGCPACGNRRATVQNSLRALYPAVAQQWHPTRNGHLTPDAVVAGSGKRYWWRCDKGHEWEREVEKRTKAARGCPFCAGRLLPGQRSKQ